MLKNKRDDFEIDSKSKVNPLPRIPEGNYEAVCIKKEISSHRAKERKLYLHFQIIEGEYQGTRLFEVLNVNYNSFPRGSKYYTDWSIANGSLPKRTDKMSTKVFLDKALLVKVRDAVPKYDDGTPKPEMFRYSVVDRIIERLTA